MKSKGSIRTTITAILFVAFTINSLAQTVTGYVRDAATGTPLSNASVAIKGQHGGARTNSEGRFRLQTDKIPIDIVVSNVGYDATTIHLDPFPRLDIQIKLNRQFKELGKATVRNKRQKYRNKGNP